MSVARKSHRQPLPKALAEMEGLLLDGHGDGEGGGEGLPPLPAEFSERDKINALAPRSHCPTLRGHAHMLRGWRNAAVHERSKWRQPPSDADVSHVIQGVMSELERLGW